MQSKLELLSPAGSIDAAKAALCNGADAVYLGAASFGARSSVGFDEDGLRDVIRLCHLHGRRVHVTVNTLIKENEFDSVRKTLELLDRLKADAVLVQDLGLLSYIKANFPAFQVHLSTQMSLNNRTGAEFCRKMQADRLVLARECSLETIRDVAASGIETEVFVHGALCVCVSGQCLFSSMVGGRSGNRGRCAQPCRMEYTYNGKTAAWLSPRDICMRDHLKELIDAGAVSAKIEGRLKRPEYVALVTGAYRKAIDSVYEGAFSPADENEKLELRQIFSRGGFTEGYAVQKQDAGIMYPARAAAEGIYIGKTGKCSMKNGVPLCEFFPVKKLNNGDYLEIGNQNIIYSGNDVPAGGSALLRLHKAVPNGTEVIRMQDECQLSRARKTYEEPEKCAALNIPVSAELYAYPGKPCRLSLCAGECRAETEGPVCSEALSAPLTAEKAAKSIGKLGGTFFSLQSFSCHTENAFVSASDLNEMRRNAADRLTETLIAANEEKVRVPHPIIPMPESVRNESEAEIYVQFSDISLQELLIRKGIGKRVYQPRDYRQGHLEEQLSLLEKGTYVALPVACSDRGLNRVRKAITGYSLIPALSNVSQLTLPLPEGVISLMSIPLYNSRTKALLSSFGCRASVISPELSETEVRQLPAGDGGYILPAYGRQRLMILTHCPMRTFLGLDKGKEHCTLCDAGKGCAGTCMEDSFHASYPLFPIRFEEGCRVHLMSDQKLDLSLFGPELMKKNISLLLTFTDETEEEIERVLDCFLKSDSLSAEGKAGWKGRFTRGVE